LLLDNSRRSKAVVFLLDFLRKYLLSLKKMVLRNTFGTTPF
jgi:hypothetical protein